MAINDPFRRMMVDDETKTSMKEDIDALKPGARAVLITNDPDGAHIIYRLYGYPYAWEAAGLCSATATLVMNFRDGDPENDD